MKHFNLSILTALLFVFTFSSCSKDNNDPLVIEPTLAGTWDIEKMSMKLFEGNTPIQEQIIYRSELNNEIGVASFRFTDNNEFFITGESEDGEEEVKFTYTVDANNSKKLILKSEDEQAEYFFPGAELTYSFEGEKLVLEFSGENMYGALSTKVRAAIGAQADNSRVVITITSSKRK